MNKFSSFSNPSSSDSTSAAAIISGSGKGKKKKGFPAVKLSTDPQSVAARQRRHRISDRFKILQTLVPGGSKLDTVSMLEQAIQYVKFLKAQIWLHESMINFVDVDVDDHNAAAAAADPAITTSSTTFLQPNNCGILPFREREFDSYDDICAANRFLAESGQLDLPESWFSGEENWGFN